MPVFGLKYLVLCAASALATGLFVRFSKKWGAMAYPAGHRLHSQPVPTLGGSVIYLVLSAQLLFLGSGGRQAFFFWVAITMIYALGLVDDLIQLRSRTKLFGQLIAATVLGWSQTDAPGIAALITHHPSMTVILFYLFIVGSTNAVNISDGLDGLCTGMSLISVSTLMVAGLWLGKIDAPWAVEAACALSAACLGFFIHNRHPAKIYLGDCGSLLLGFALAGLCLRLKLEPGAEFAIPLFILGMPCIEMASSMIRRKRERRPMMSGDRGHVHHRLLAMGMGHRRAVRTLFAVGAYLNWVALLALYRPIGWIAFALAIPPLVLLKIGFDFMERRFTQQKLAFFALYKGARAQTWLSDEEFQARTATAGGRIIVTDCMKSILGILDQSQKRPLDYLSELCELIFAVPGSFGNVSLDHIRILFWVPESADNLLTKIKALQEAYQIYQTDPKLPVGIQIQRPDPWVEAPAQSPEKAA